MKSEMLIVGIVVGVALTTAIRGCDKKPKPCEERCPKKIEKENPCKKCYYQRYCK